LKLEPRLILENIMAAKKKDTQAADTDKEKAEQEAAAKAEAEAQEKAEQEAAAKAEAEAQEKAEQEAAAKAEEAQKPKETAEQDSDVPALFIKSKSQHGFRRCGHRFTPDGYGIALELLTDDQIETLQNDPELIVEECTVSAAEVAEA
jgi:flagellar biosynthesis GTPase FlhF